jgi:hypothetical protein
MQTRPCRYCDRPVDRVGGVWVHVERDPDGFRLPEPDAIESVVERYPPAVV